MVEENILRLFTDVVLSPAPSPVDRLIAAKADGRAGSGGEPDAAERALLVREIDECCDLDCESSYAITSSCEKLLV